METEQYSEDDLPWGAAAVPDWWVELTPHNVMDYGEIERELRRELARIGITPPPTEDDGALLADTGAGPYSLPGFTASDGITDASFIAPGGEKWYITSEGYFYSREDPDVRYTPSQMVESGHLPPGMDSYFEEGWDHARARSTTPAGLYAREEGTAWERPDWLKKKLRSTDQGMALRSPGSFSEPPSPAGSNHESTSRTPSESPVPTWQLKRQQILKDKADAEEVTMLAPPQLGQAVMDESVSTTSTLPPWKRKKSQAGGENDNHEEHNRGRSSSPEWKKKQRAMSLSRSVSPTPSSSWRNKKNDDGGDDANVPEWKRKHAAMARSRSSSPSAPNRKEEDESTLGRGNMKKQYEEATAKQTEENEDKPVPGRGSKVSQYEAAAAKQDDDDGSKPVVPGRGSKKSAYEAAMARNRSSSPAPPVRKPSSAWRKKADEFNPPWKTPETTEEDPKPMPAWKKKQQEAKEAREKEEEARRKEEERKKEEEAQKEKGDEGDPRGDPEAIKLVAQGFVLKLLAIEDDAARAKELRNTIAPTKQNNHKVLVKPEELLTAFAYHAQIWKTQEENQEKVNHLRQVAIIARLVIMKLYGANSAELTHFQEGLRPAFA